MLISVMLVVFGGGGMAIDVDKSTNIINTVATIEGNEYTDNSAGQGAVVVLVEPGVGLSLISC